MGKAENGKKVFNACAERFGYKREHKFRSFACILAHTPCHPRLNCWSGNMKIHLETMREPILALLQSFANLWWLVVALEQCEAGLWRAILGRKLAHS